MGIRIFRYKNSKPKKFDEERDKELIKKLERDPDYKELMII